MVLSARRGRWVAIALNARETDVDLVLSLDGVGENGISTGISTMDRLIQAFVKAGRFDMDLRVQYEGEPVLEEISRDVGTAVGRALNQALGDAGTAEGLCGDATVPVKENLYRAVLEMGHPHDFHFGLDDALLAGSDELRLCYHFFKSLAEQGRFTLHLDLLNGSCDEGIVEGYGKACGAALKAAIRYA